MIFSPRFLMAASSLVFSLTAWAGEPVTPPAETTPPPKQATDPAPQSTPETLPGVAVSAPRVANKESTESFAMPVTALRFDPRVDVQARSMGEAQADVSIRGGTFENTSFSIGAVPIYDPQTGHYFAELPVAPAMLATPEVRTGAVNAQTGWNATAGNVAYGWLPIVNSGSITLGTGNDSLFTTEAYAGFVAPEKFLGRTIGFDLSAAYSNGDGPVQYSDHDFQRYNGRLQLRDDTSQTDIFAGYQTKDFAWPNLYAGRVPGGPWREEREDLKTQLYAVNHRQELNGTGDWIQAGAYYRINEDHYSIPAFSYRADHKTHTSGGGFDGRVTLVPHDSGFGTTALRYRAGIIADDLTSTALTFGRYNSRTQIYAGLYADQTVALDKTRELVFTAGVTYDDSNREDAAFSPVAGIAWRQNDPDAWLRRIGLDYAESTQTPTYTALNSAPTGFFGGDRDLGRAYTRNVELSADLAAAGWQLTPAVFYRQDNDLVDWVFDPANPASNRSARAVDLDTWGVELVARGSWEIFDFTFGYSWLHKTDDYTTPITASFYALNFAEHRVTAAVVAHLGHGFEVRCDNEFRVQEYSSLRSTTNKPFFTSLGIVWRVPDLPGLSIAAQVDNLWNVDYEEVPLVPGTPRTWSLSATYAW